MIGWNVCCFYHQLFGSGSECCEFSFLYRTGTYVTGTSLTVTVVLSAEWKHGMEEKGKGRSSITRERGLTLIVTLLLLGSPMS